VGQRSGSAGADFGSAERSETKPLYLLVKMACAAMVGVAAGAASCARLCNDMHGRRKRSDFSASRAVFTPRGLSPVAVAVCDGRQSGHRLRSGCHSGAASAYRLYGLASEVGDNSSAEWHTHFVRSGQSGPTAQPVLSRRCSDGLRIFAGKVGERETVTAAYLFAQRPGRAQPTR
jgi:hypothetical protein